MKTTASDRELERIKSVAALLYTACRPLRILRTLAWTPEVKEAFLAGGGRELPQVTYPPFDPTPSIEAVREARCIVPVTTIDLWLERQAQAIELGARMLTTVGTPSFFEYGRQVCGEPTAPLRYVPLTPLDPDCSPGLPLGRSGSGGSRSRRPVPLRRAGARRGVGRPAIGQRPGHVAVDPRSPRRPLHGPGL